MADEVMELLRKCLIDKALEARDWKRLQRLTNRDWERHVVSSNRPSFEFLRQDIHFFECRVIDDAAMMTLVNFRYKDISDDIVYIGEIRIPIRGEHNVTATYAPKKRTTECNCSVPQWFSLLTKQAREALELRRNA